MWRIAEDPHYPHVLCAARPTAQAPFRVSHPHEPKSIPDRPPMSNGIISLPRPNPGVTGPYPRRSGSISRPSSLRMGKQLALRRLSRTIRQKSLRFLSMVLSADSSSDSHLELDGHSVRDTVRSHSSDSITYKPASSSLRRTAVSLLFRYISSAWSANLTIGTHVHMQRIVFQILHQMNHSHLLQPPVISSERDNLSFGVKEVLNDDSSNKRSSFQWTTSQNVVKP